VKRPQAGAALLAAMLTVTLVATFAAGALWQQWRSVEVEAADRSRVQSAWILTGALDWARLILREDRSGTDDHLGEPWAVPLQEARLSTFLAADQNNNTEAGDADNVFLSGDIADLQARMNVLNLAQKGTHNPDWYDAFGRLFEVLGLPQQELFQLAENLRLASEISVDSRNAGRAPLEPQRVEQLVWLGVSPQTVAVLEPHVTILREMTPVNLNTASAEAIYAAVPKISLADAQRLVAERERKPFKTVRDAKALLPEGAEIVETRVSAGSRFFEVRGRLRIDDVVIEERSIVQRASNGAVTTLLRERGTARTEQAVAPARR
jgi:general secretion pathway protein K